MPRKPKTSVTENAAPATVKRGRKPSAPAEKIGPEFVGATPPAMAIQEEKLRLAHKMVLNYEGVLRDLGRLDFAEFTRRVADVAMAQIFENVRSSKAYIGLPYINEVGEYAIIADLEQFCEVKLGKSYRRCLDLAQNLRTLGPELYEQSERLGLRNVDYKALRALPADEQALVKRAVEEAKSRDEVLGILQELAAKHQRERDEQQREITEKDGRISDLERLNADKSKRIDELTVMPDSAVDLQWPDVIRWRKDEIHAVAKTIDDIFGVCLKLVDKTDQEIEQLDAGSAALAGYKPMIHQLGELIERVCTYAAGLRNQFDTNLGYHIAMDKTYVLDDDAKMSGGHTNL
jgi:hypothetical protein